MRFDSIFHAPIPSILLHQQICQRERAPFAVVGRATEEEHLTVTDAHFAGNETLDTPIDLPLDVLLGKTPKIFKDVVSQTAAGDKLVVADITLSDAR